MHFIFSGTHNFHVTPLLKQLNRLSIHSFRFQIYIFSTSFATAFSPSQFQGLIHVYVQFMWHPHHMAHFLSTTKFRLQPRVPLHFHHKRHENTRSKMGCFLLILTICLCPTILLHEDLPKNKKTPLYPDCSYSPYNSWKCIVLCVKNIQRDVS